MRYIALFLFPFLVFGKPANWKRELGSFSILKGRPHLKKGVVVLDINSGQVLYEQGADEQLIPASVNKVFTAYTALKKLKPNTTFKTSIWTTGSSVDGKLVGDLYLKGGGDPSLVSERMWMLVNDFMRLGIRSISGNLYGDTSYFDDQSTPDTRPKYLKDQAYNAPIGALSFNFNTTTIYVRPAETEGAKPIVYIDPENPYIDVVNHASTTKAGSPNRLNVSRIGFVQGDLGDTVLIEGGIPIGSKELRVYRNIVDSTRYTLNMFKTFLAQRGVTLDGKIAKQSVPPHAKMLLEFDSQPIWQIIWGMNKFSNNFVADQLLKKVGAESWGTPGTLKKGLSSMEELLDDIGIPKKSYQIQDGSGLTRQTKVTARQIVKVLSAAYKDLSISSEFTASLGIGGEDGTLRERLKNLKPGTIIRAKTGSLDGVASLAGYLSSPGGPTLAFAIILNDPKGKYGRMAPWIDEVVEQIAKLSRKA